MIRVRRIRGLLKWRGGRGSEGGEKGREGENFEEKNRFKEIYKGHPVS